MMADLDPESEEFYENLTAEMTYVATFGLEDPIRPEVEQSVQRIRYG